YINGAPVLKSTVSRSSDSSYATDRTVKGSGHAPLKRYGPSVTVCCFRARSETVTGVTRTIVQPSGRPAWKPLKICPFTSIVDLILMSMGMGMLAGSVIPIVRPEGGLAFCNVTAAVSRFAPFPARVLANESFPGPAFAAHLYVSGMVV